MLDQKIEGFGTHRGRPEHEGHLPIDFADDDDVPAAGALRRQVFQQVDRDIGVRSQAVFRAPFDAAFADQLRDDIDAMRRHVARHLRVVGADIVTLRVRHIEQRAGIQKELDDLHIFGPTSPSCRSLT